MNVTIYNSDFCGEIKACPSKSYEQRVWALSVLSSKEFQVENQGNSNDVVACRNIAQKLKNYDLDNEIFNCGESALCARLFPPIIALNHKNFTITGNGSLPERKIAQDFEFYKTNFSWQTDENNFPIKIRNAQIVAGNYEIDGSKTSQIISGLILALSVANGDSNLIVNNPVSTNYILMTIDIANKAGAEIHYSHENNSLNINIKGNTNYFKTDFLIEGDWSNVAFLIAGALIKGNVKISGLNCDSLQADKAILEILDMINAKYSWENGILQVCKSKFSGFEFDATNCPDLIPPLCAIAINATSKSTIKGAKRLIRKESNRLEVIIGELSKIGVSAICENDNLIITPCHNMQKANVSSHNDHRIAMMLAIIGINSQGLSINGCECVNKSYPKFFNDIRKLGVNWE